MFDVASIRKRRKIFIETLYEKIDELIDNGEDLFAVRDMVTYYERHYTEGEDNLLHILEFIFSKIESLNYCVKLIKRYKEVRYD